MAYSNGYDVSAVYTALANRIGFRQPIGSGVPTLSSAVTTSNSGRYFQDFHSLVTVANIKATMEQPSASDADLITYLTDLRKAAIMRSLNGVFNSVQLIDEPLKLFARQGQNDEVVENSGLFVGYKINVADIPGAGVQIDALQLYFDAAATFNVYLFKDGQLAAEWTQAVTTVANKITELALTDKVLNRGIYYLGYFQDDTGAAKAYREQVCNWNKTLYFKAEAIHADATGAATFNREEILYTADPYGLNVEMSSFKDHTIPVKRKAALFDELTGLTLAYMVIEQIIYAARSNKDERILKDQLDKIGLQLDLSGAAPISDSPQVQGLKQRIVKETNSVLKSFYPKPKATTVNLAHAEY
jgi:hypothetical protein